MKENIIMIENEENTNVEMIEGDSAAGEKIFGVALLTLAGVGFVTGVTWGVGKIKGLFGKKKGEKIIEAECVEINTEDDTSEEDSE